MENSQEQTLDDRVKAAAAEIAEKFAVMGRSDYRNKLIVDDIAAIISNSLGAPVPVAESCAVGELKEALMWAERFLHNIDSAGCSRAECKRGREVAAILSKRLGSAAVLQLDKVSSRSLAPEIAKALNEDFGELYEDVDAATPTSTEDKQA